MDPATVRAIIAGLDAIGDALGFDWKKLAIGMGLLGSGLIMFVVFLPFLVGAGLFAGAGAVIGAVVGAAAGPPPAIGLWAAGLATSIAYPAGVPPVLALAVMAHESGGNWTARHHNSNGTTDAGLMQVNSANWAAYGLGKDPYNPAANLRAGVAILSADLARYPGNVAAALEAYNAGSAMAGAIYDPGYAGAVLGEAQRIESGPRIAATPLPVGKHEWLVTAWAPYGPSQTYDGQQWPVPVPPGTIVASAGTPLEPCQDVSAKSEVGRVIPPGAVCWVVQAPQGGTTVTATWTREVEETFTLPDGHTVTQRRRQAVAASVRVRGHR